MASRTFKLLLLAAGIGVAVYRMGQRPQGADMSNEDDVDATSDATEFAPNLGESMRGMKLATAGIGSAANLQNEDLLAPPRGEDQQSEEIKPGLPDFARGA